MEDDQVRTISEPAIVLQELPIVARCVGCLRGYVSTSSSSPDPKCFTCGQSIKPLAEPTAPTSWDCLKRPFKFDNVPPKSLSKEVRWAY